jgi:hypothetical protein
MTKPTELQCSKCNDTGMIAIRSRDGSYAFPGPVPDDAKGYADADCWYCDCARSPLGSAEEDSLRERFDLMHKPAEY